MYQVEIYPAPSSIGKRWDLQQLDKRNDLWRSVGRFVKQDDETDSDVSERAHRRAQSFRDTLEQPYVRVRHTMHVRDGDRTKVVTNTVYLQKRDGLPESVSEGRSHFPSLAQMTH